MAKEKDLHEDNDCSQILQEIEYDNDALNIFFDRQYKFQKFVSEKRNTLSPPAVLSDVKLEHILESMYHMQCANIEIYELLIGNEECVDDINIKFEIADILHFIINSFIYIGITTLSNHDFKDLYIASCEEDNIDYTDLDDFYKNNSNLIRIAICAINLNYSKLINYYPFKKWRSYAENEIKYDRVKIESCIKSILVNFITIARVFMMDYKDIYQYYISKNNENIRRQCPGGIYEK